MRFQLRPKDSVVRAKSAALNWPNAFSWNYETTFLFGGVADARCGKYSN